MKRNESDAGRRIAVTQNGNGDPLAPPDVPLRAGDAIHTATELETGEKEIWTDDRHLLARRDGRQDLALQVVGLLVGEVDGRDLDRVGDVPQGGCCRRDAMIGCEASGLSGQP